MQYSVNLKQIVRGQYLIYQEVLLIINTPKSYEGLLKFHIYKLKSKPWPELINPTRYWVEVEKGFGENALLL